MSSLQLPPPIVYQFDNHCYDLNKAIRLLGPQDIFPANEKRNECIERVCSFISEIWITIQRIFNYLWGDHEWYNNETAYQIVFNYYQNTDLETHNYPEDNHIKQLYLQLMIRKLPEEQTDLTYIDRLHHECGDLLRQRQTQEMADAIHSEQQNILAAFTEKNNHPLFEKVNDEEINDFVARFLHPYISGEITQDNEIQNRPGLMTLLKEQIGQCHDNNHVNLELVERRAFWAYLKTAALGLYVYLPRTMDYIGRRSIDIIEPIDNEIPSKYSDNFNILIEALIPAIKIDFPGSHIDRSLLIELAEKAFNEVNKEREVAFEQAMDFIHPEEEVRRSLPSQPEDAEKYPIPTSQTFLPKAPTSSQELVWQTLMKNNENKPENEQSWFLTPEQSWFGEHADELVKDGKPQRPSQSQALIERTWEH
jgi:hypothetical protein